MLKAEDGWHGFSGIFEVCPTRSSINSLYLGISRCARPLPSRLHRPCRSPQSLHSRSGNEGGAAARSGGNRCGIAWPLIQMAGARSHSSSPFGTGRSANAERSNKYEPWFRRRCSALPGLQFANGKTQVATRDTRGPGILGLLRFSKMSRYATDLTFSKTRKTEI
jgi:hypothetical protein